MIKKIIAYVFAFSLVLLVVGCENIASIDEQKMSSEGGNQNRLSQVLCDGNEYTLDVNPQDAIILMTMVEEQKERIFDGESESIAQEIFEVGRNEKNSNMQLTIRYDFALTGSMGSQSEDFGAGKRVYLLHTKINNLEILETNLNTVPDYGFSLLARNDDTKNGELSFSCSLV